MFRYDPLSHLDPGDVRCALKALGETRTFGTLSESALAGMLARPELLPGGCWTARDAGGLAGFVLSALGETLVTVLLLSVRADSRRRGIGRALLARVAAAARARRIGELRTVPLNTRDEAAVAFFEAAGWQSEDTGSLRMRRDLDALPVVTPEDVPIAEGYCLRTFEEGDAEAWVRVRNTAFATEAHSHDPWTVETFQRSFRDDPVFAPDRVFLAVRRSDGEVAGTTSSWDYRIDGRAVGLIHWVAVAPEHRGKRLGHSLMLRALLDMKSRGHAEAYLNTNAALRHAVQLYESVGFTIDERRVRYRAALR